MWRELTKPCDTTEPPLGGKFDEVNREAAQMANFIWPEGPIDFNPGQRPGNIAKQYSRRDGQLNSARTSPSAQI